MKARNKAEGGTKLFYWCCLSFWKIIGWAGIIAGVLGNPQVLKYFFSQDGVLEPITIKTIYLVDIAFMIVSVVVLFLSKKIDRSSRKSKMRFIEITVLSVVMFIIFILTELFLAIAYPQMTTLYAVTHSPRIFIEGEKIPWTLKPNASDIQIAHDFKINISINSLGLRDEERAIKKPTRKILVVGDSFTFGYGVENNETFSHRLEMLFKSDGKPFEVWNAGYAAGFSPDSYLIYLEEKIPVFKPNLVILAYFGENDITDMEKTVWDVVDGDGFPKKISSPVYEIKNNKMRKKQFVLNTPLSKIKHGIYSLLQRLHTFVLISQVYEQLVKKDEIRVYRDGWDEQLEQDWGRVKHALKGIKQVLLKHKIPWVIVLIPSRIQVNEQFWQKYVDLAEAIVVRDKPQALMLDFCRKEKMACLDLYPIFLDTSDDAYLKYDGHWNAEGNEKASIAIYKYVSKFLN